MNVQNLVTQDVATCRSTKTLREVAQILPLPDPRANGAIDPPSLHAGEPVEILAAMTVSAGAQPLVMDQMLRARRRIASPWCRREARRHTYQLTRSVDAKA